MGQDTQDMNASFGRHSGRGNRRENYYQFRRQDSHDSSKLNELLRKSAEGRLKSPRGQPKNPTQSPLRQQTQKKDHNTINVSQINDYQAHPGEAMSGRNHAQINSFRAARADHGAGVHAGSVERLGAERDGAGGRGDRLEAADQTSGNAFKQRHKSTVPMRSNNNRNTSNP